MVFIEPEAVFQSSRRERGPLDNDLVGMVYWTQMERQIDSAFNCKFNNNRDSLIGTNSQLFYEIKAIF